MALVIAAGYLFLKNDDPNGITGDAITEYSSSEIQKIVIGFKNYNYYPNLITVKVGVPVSISLDESVGGCLRDFTIRELGIRQYLKTPQESIQFVPTKPGKYTFACSMGMGTGTLVVE
ncbi:MAG TPA: cupredoxin domain-containing protein [Candidatus Nanoarchaeia archaeon]|nr:cupredoxin domain-containing protein [Candidatus Nanoarchaeia archaeon]